MREIKDAPLDGGNIAGMHADMAEHRPTVFVVDDDDAVRRALAFSLDLGGFAVRTFGSGEELIAAAPLGPGCLVLDERLPGASGLEVLARLRTLQVDLPAILITTHPSAKLRSAAASAGAPILEKPVLGGPLVVAIKDALTRTGAGA